MHLTSVTSSGARTETTPSTPITPLSSSFPVIAPVPGRVSGTAGTDKVLNADPTDVIASDCEDVSFRPTG
jgi:hypothetical protein